MNSIDLERPRATNSRLIDYETNKLRLNRLLYTQLTQEGFVIIQKAPIGNCKTDNERRSAALQFLNKIPLLGDPLKQNTEGEKVWLVRNEGAHVIFDESNRPKVNKEKGSKSNAFLGFHNDAAAEWQGQNINFVMLLAFSQALKGGDTTLVDAREAYSTLLYENEDAARVLTDSTFYFDRSSGYDEGQLPYSQGPIIGLDPKFQVKYTPRILQGFETAGKKLSPEQINALALWEEVLGREEFHIKFRLEPNDILVLNEQFMLHSRTSYRDDPDNPRVLGRIWTAGTQNDTLV